MGRNWPLLVTCTCYITASIRDSRGLGVSVRVDYHAKDCLRVGISTYVGTTAGGMIKLLIRDNYNVLQSLGSFDISLVQGMTNKEIAEHLFISINTVITHRRNIARKLQIHSPAGLIIYAIVNGIVDISSVKL